MRTNLGLKSGNPDTDANRRLARLEQTILQIPSRWMVPPASLSPQSIIITSHASSSPVTPPKTGQLTIIIIGGGMGGNGGQNPILSANGYLYYGGAGGGSGAMAVIQVNAADITGNITFSCGASSAGGSTGSPAGAGNASSVSFTWKGHTLTVTAGAGYPNPTYTGPTMPGFGGQVSVSYGGTALPAVIGYSGQNGGVSPLIQGFGQGGSAWWYSGEGQPGKGWMISTIASPTNDGYDQGWGAGGFGADGMSLSAQTGNPGFFAMIS